MINFLFSFRVLYFYYMLAFLSLTPVAKLKSFEPVETYCDGGKYDSKIYTLVKRILNCKKSPNAEIALETMFEIKSTVENYNHKKFDIDKTFKILEEKMEENKVKINKRNLEEIKEYIKKAEMHYKHKLKYRTDCSFYNIPYDSELEHLDFLTTHGYSDESSDEPMIPMKLRVGVPMVLAGACLLYFPCTSGLGETVITTGLILIVDGICEYTDEEEKEMRKKRKEERKRRKEENK